MRKKVEAKDLRTCGLNADDPVSKDALPVTSLLLIPNVPYYLC